MEINPSDFQDYFHSIRDSELIDFPWDAWVQAAREVYESELAQRGLAVSGEEIELESSDGPDWLEDAVSACGFLSGPGSPRAAEAEKAIGVLESAGIPCHLSVKRADWSNMPQPQYDYLVMVPGAQILLATSILDREIFNAKEAADWKIHLAGLSDEDLRALDPNEICAGFLDRAQRLQQAYRDETASRACV